MRSLDRADPIVRPDRPVCASLTGLVHGRGWWQVLFGVADEADGDGVGDGVCGDDFGDASEEQRRQTTRPGSEVVEPRK